MAATNVVDDWNERDAKKRASNNWRASLVPAAAVIPAPRVYTKAVAVKKLVVNFRKGGVRRIVNQILFGDSFFFPRKTICFTHIGKKYLDYS